MMGVSIFNPMSWRFEKSEPLSLLDDEGSGVANQCQRYTGSILE
jgi:hypothetical protein